MLEAKPYLQKIGSEIKSIVKKLAIAYVLVCILMFGLQRKLMYTPITNINSPASYGLNDFTNITLETKDNIQVQTWYHAAKENYPTIIYFHGNGGNLSYRTRFFSLLSGAGFGVLALDYRGYGNSEGSPSEEGFYQDARATMDYAIEELSLTHKQIIVYGASIGTAVAIQMANEYKISALILQSPFTSMTAMGKLIFPWLPINLLLKDRFDSLSKITKVNVPILLFHGEKDSLVPVRQGRKLFSYAIEPKQALYFPETGHHNFDLQKTTEAVIKFTLKHKLAN